MHPSADVLLPLGSVRRSHLELLAARLLLHIPPTKLIHVDIDPEGFGRILSVALGLMADGRTFLRQVLAEPKRAATSTRRRNRTRSGSPRSMAIVSNERLLWRPILRRQHPIHPQRAPPSRSLLPKDAIVVSDIGSTTTG